MAMEELATYYYEDRPAEMRGEVVSRVIGYYEEAAEAGRQRACLNLGAIYSDGMYASADRDRAEALLTRARLGENRRLAALACARLGDLCVNEDTARAFDYYLEGVLLCDHPICLYKLGDTYRDGAFVRRDVEKAYFIYEKAKAVSAERFGNDGYGEILLRLARAKLVGEGTAVDAAGARKYLTIAKRLPRKSSVAEDVPALADALLAKIG